MHILPLLSAWRRLPSPRRRRRTGGCWRSAKIEHTGSWQDAENDADHWRTADPKTKAPRSFCSASQRSTEAFYLHRLAQCLRRRVGGPSGTACLRVPPAKHSQVVLLLVAGVDRGVVLGGGGSGLLLLVATRRGKSNADGREDGAEGTVGQLGTRLCSWAAWVRVPDNPRF